MFAYDGNFEFADIENISAQNSTRSSDVQKEKILSFPNYYEQSDYSSYYLGNSTTLTIASSGCALTAFSSVRDYLVGEPYMTPVEVNNRFLVPLKTTYMLWNKAPNYFSGISYDTTYSKTYYATQEETNSAIYDFLDDIKTTLTEISL